MITFILVVLLLFIVPGPAVIITVTQTLKGGRKNGFLTGIGIGIADLCHTIAAVAGLSAILMTSSLAFEIIKYAGAFYLFYLGISSFITKKQQKSAPTNRKKPSNNALGQAFLIELLNPKTSLFFLAFLPQFVRSDGFPITIQLLILGITFVIMSIMYTSLLVLVSDTVGNKILLKANQNSSWFPKVVGIVYIGLGLRLAVESQT